MNTPHRRFALLAVAAMLGTVAGIATAAPAPPSVVDGGLDLAQMSGNGERLILVVAGAYDSRDAADKAAAKITFGDMAGFYVDAATNYEVIGFYGQSKPDLVAVACDNVPHAAGDCEPGSIVIIHQPVSLEYHAKSAAPGLLTTAPALCDAVGQAPCMARRLGQLLHAPDWQFTPGQQLVLSAFRTRRGAEEFAELARDRGAISAVVRVRKLGGGYVGLGQEANPDGVSGPLVDPLGDPDPYQE